MLIDINISPGYSTRDGNLAHMFYNPVLSESVLYSRVSGYFNSKSLIYLSKGIEGLLNNQGKYKLIISQEISEEDYLSIEQGYALRAEIYNGVADKLNFQTDLENYAAKDLANLGFLISIGLVDIKIGFIKTGKFHAKYGLMHDKEGNIVYFNGSSNETKSGIQYNFETIDIKTSWLHESEKEYILNKQAEFDDLWSGQLNDEILYVSEVNELVKFKLESFNKGRLIIDEKVFAANSLILDYYDNQLELINNLDDQNQIGDSLHINKLKRKFLVNKEQWMFKPNLSYVEVDEVITTLKKHCNKSNLKLMILDSVDEFITSSKFEIDEIAQRGLLIKNQDSSLVNQVNIFSDVVDNEMAENFSLRGIQRWVSFYMTQMKRVANFSVPGSGKTAMVYGTFAYLSSEKIDQVDQIIMIGPKNSFISWKDEFRKIFNGKRTLRVLDIHSEDFEKNMFYRNPRDYDLILINYEALIKYSEELQYLVNDRTMVVFDEIHKLKNPESEKVPIAINLANKTQYRYVLTGTPIPNSYLDIWNFLHILYDNEYKSHFLFSPLELANADAVTQKHINERLNPFFWRVTKKDLNVPPPNNDHFIDYVANDKEQEIIDLLWIKYRNQPFVLYTRLIQLSSNPSLLSKNIEKNMFDDVSPETDLATDKLTFEYFSEMEDDVKDFYTTDELDLLSSLETTQKFEGCISKINSLVEQRKTVIVWCTFVDTVEKVNARLKQMGISCEIINGQVKDTERESIIKSFQEGKFSVLVTNPHTLAESVSLHKSCHDAIYLEYSFNLTHMLQSRDRIHRLGLSPDDETNYYYCMLKGQLDSRNTIDEKMYERLKEKESVMLNAIESDNLDISFNENQRDEILSLMSDIE